MAKPQSRIGYSWGTHALAGWMATPVQNVVVKSFVSKEEAVGATHARLRAALRESAEAIARSAEVFRSIAAEISAESIRNEPNHGDMSVDVMEPLSARGRAVSFELARSAESGDIARDIQAVVADAQRLLAEVRAAGSQAPARAEIDRALAASRAALWEQEDPLALSHYLSESFFEPVDTGELLVGQARIRANRMREFDRDYGLLSSEQVARLSGSRAKNVSQLAHRWQKQGRIFGVKVDNRTRFPGFQFDNEGQPRRVVADLLRVLPLSEGWSIAFWFSTPNASLPRHQAPADVLEHNPELALKAAEHTTQRASDWV